MSCLFVCLTHTGIKFVCWLFYLWMMCLVVSSLQHGMGWQEYRHSVSVSLATEMPNSWTTCNKDTSQFRVHLIVQVTEEPKQHWVFLTEHASNFGLSNLLHRQAYCRQDQKWTCYYFCIPMTRHIMAWLHMVESNACMLENIQTHENHMFFPAITSCILISTNCIWLINCFLN